MDEVRLGQEGDDLHPLNARSLSSTAPSRRRLSNVPRVINGTSVKWVETALPGAFEIRAEPVEDARGYFARVCCDREFEARGLNTRWVQCNLSFNRRAGTLRGMHYQAPPHQEVKLVRCIRGAVHDVIVDLREGSSTRGRWHAVELSAELANALYIPAGFAHGFYSLVDDSELYYQMGDYYQPAAARGFRWDDAAVGIEWPSTPSVISDKDRRLPSLGGSGE